MNLFQTHHASIVFANKGAICKHNARLKGLKQRGGLGGVGGGWGGVGGGWGGLGAPPNTPQHPPTPPNPPQPPLGGARFETDSWGIGEGGGGGGENSNPETVHNKPKHPNVEHRRRKRMDPRRLQQQGCSRFVGARCHNSNNGMTAGKCL